MVLANVAAAEELIAKRQPLLFRVHEEPAPEKLEALREVATARASRSPRAGAADRHLNRLLAQAEGTRFRRADQHHHAARHAAGLLQPRRISAISAWR
jgi:ribonuclease R